MPPTRAPQTDDPETDARETDVGERLRWPREASIAALVAAWVVLVALWTPITHLGTHTFGPWDWLAESSPLTSLPGPTEVQTHAMEDPVRQMLPWAVFAREQFARGEAPLWNPLNGAGIPVLANFQSAPFSPFVVPFYLFPLWAATLLTAASKLAVAAASAYLFLRLVGRSTWAAAFGAAVYGLCCFHVTLALHPHVGVLALVPLGLFVVELVARAFERDSSHLPWRRLACLSLVLGATVLAGHPESLLFSVYCVAAYALFRWVQLALAARRYGAPSTGVVRLGLALFAFGLAGGALGAVQILPFAEYLSRSAAVALGGREVEYLRPLHAVLFLFPNAAGTPRDEPWIPHALQPHYHEINAFHLGGAPALLAVAAALFLGRDRRAWFFASLGGGVLLYAFNAPIVNVVLRPLFGAEFVPAPRAACIWTMCGAYLASFAADRLLAKGDETPRRRGAVFLVGAAALLAAARAGSARLWTELEGKAPDIFAQLEPAVREHVGQLSWAAAVGIAAVAVHLVVRRQASRVAAFVVLLTLGAANVELCFRDYVPTSEDRYVLPRTPAVEGFLEDLGGERVAMLSHRALRSNANLFYGVDLVTSYDALEIRELDDLRTEIFGYGGYQAISPYATRRGLDLFGASFVATLAEWLPLDTERCQLRAPNAQRMWPIAVELGLGGEPRTIALDPRYRQEFVATRDRLDGVVLHVKDEAKTARAVVRATLSDAETGDTLAERSVRVGELRLLPRGRRELVLRVAVPPETSRGRTYVLEAGVEDAPAGAVVQLIRARGSRGDGAKAVEDDDETEEEVDDAPAQAPLDAEAAARRARREARRDLASRAILDVSYDQGDFSILGEHGGFVLHRYDASLGRSWLVHASEVEADRSKALARVLHDDFDPRAAVLLEEGAARSAPADVEAELVELAREPRRWSWRFSTSAPAHLVVAQAFYPGWRAEIDGRLATLVRANFAFTAIELPPGAGEVVLRYDPPSFRWGMLASLASLAGVLGVLFAARRSGRRSA